MTSTNQNTSLGSSLVPSADQVAAQLRLIIPPIGVIISAIGIAKPAAVDTNVALAMTLVGPISYLISAVWSLYANTRKSIMLSAAKPASAGLPPPQIVLPAQEAGLAHELPANVNTTETVKVVSQ